VGVDHPGPRPQAGRAESSSDSRGRVCKGYEYFGGGPAVKGPVREGAAQRGSRLSHEQIMEADPQSGAAVEERRGWGKSLPWKSQGRAAQPRREPGKNDILVLLGLLTNKRNPGKKGAWTHKNTPHS